MYDALYVLGFNHFMQSAAVNISGYFYYDHYNQYNRSSLIYHRLNNYQNIYIFI